jgi:formylglycine-generating enzyme required for sulfatase activity
MSRVSTFVLGAGALLIGVAVATPQRSQATREYARKEGKPCVYCHVNPKGGGDRNEKGIAYAKNGHSFSVPFVAETDPKTLPDFGTWVGPGGITFIKIPAGTFRMGTTDAQKEQLQKAGMWTVMDTVEQPAREVRISRPFLMSKTEVSQAQWKALMGDGNNPAAFKGDTLPIDSVSWGDAQGYCKALREKDSSGTYRLPTEAEWEYAARAGSEGLYGIGTDKTPITPDNLKSYAWMNGTAQNKTQPVGTKTANAWGLFDMQGNVWEWCQDAFSPTAYTELPAKDPLSKCATATERVLRGGCWFLDARAQRAALRGGNLPTYKSQYTGFRVVREL